ncbi:uncharacterized protein LOC128355351 [Scomber scombrus]|uniref:Uncharacterized protein LOC128355351 n=1 Tax=Scomber scombrus TaxID=13677 RepID=A0AAV1NMW9_SCOSC
MKKMKRALLIVPIALVVLGLGFMYNGDTDMITRSPQSNLDGKMVTLSRNGGGIAFYPTYYINSSDSNSEYQTSPPPTRPYPYRLYPYGFYPTRPSYYSNYGNRFYPTQPYRNQFYFNKPYRNRFYPTQPYPYRFYPTQAYRNRFYQTEAYRNRFYPTQAYRNRFYPTQDYRNRFYQTEDYRNRFYPTQDYRNRFYQTEAYRNRFYPTQPYPDQFLPTTPYPRPYTTRPYRTTRYTTTPPTLYPTTTHYPRPYRTTRYPYWTTAPTTTGVSVCVRYLTDFEQAQYPTLFTLSPASRTALRLAVRPTGWYTLSWDRFSYYRLNIKSDNRFWSNIGPELWTRVCLTVDTIKNVAQVFSGSTMSIRKMLPIKYHGSVLTWSNIGYNLRGNTLLEKRNAHKPPSTHQRCLIVQPPSSLVKKWLVSVVSYCHLPPVACRRTLSDVLVISCKKVFSVLCVSEGVKCRCVETGTIVEERESWYLSSPSSGVWKNITARK